MTALAFRFPKFMALASVLLLALQAGSAIAQLQVLSKGNGTHAWREAQLAQIESQLADNATPGELRQELSAQKKWLAGYNTTQLSEQPAKITQKSPTAIEEPLLDPNKTAGAIRKKLLGPRAKPTKADTDKLRVQLEKSPNDLGLRQLQLHWLDQPHFREVYSSEIADAAARLRGLLEIEEKLDPLKAKAANAMTLYREARALGYRLDPDVVKNKPLLPGEREKVDARLVGAYTQLMSMVGPGHPEFALLEIRMLRRDNWFGRALEVLELHAGTIEPRWYLEKRRDLLRDLGWQAPADQAQGMFASAFPIEANPEANPDAK